MTDFRGPWFRFYIQTLDNPKVQRLADGHFRVWLNLLCIAASHRGDIPKDFGDLSFQLRKPMGHVRNVMQVLISSGLIEETENYFRPKDWAHWQYEVTGSTKRMRNKRARDKGADSLVVGDVTVASHVTVDTEADTDTDAEEEVESLRDSCGKPSDEGSPPAPSDDQFEIPAFLRRPATGAVVEPEIISPSPPAQPTFDLVAPPEPEPIWGKIPTNQFSTAGEEVVITEAKVAEWQQTYPAVNVEQALRVMIQWSIDNPAQRKTKGGMFRFINGWLSREQNRASKGGPNGQFGSDKNSRFLRGFAAAAGDFGGGRKGGPD